MPSKPDVYLHVTTEGIQPLTIHFLVGESYFNEPFTRTLLDSLLGAGNCYCCGLWPYILQVHNEVRNYCNRFTFKAMGIEIPNELARLQMIRGLKERDDKSNLLHADNG